MLDYLNRIRARHGNADGLVNGVQGSSSRSELSSLLTLWQPLGVFCVCFAIAIWDGAFYARWMEGELGIVENVQVLVLAVALGFAVALLRDRRLRAIPGFLPWMVLLAAGNVYLIGEELSWGQHYFGWSTPELLAKINKQQETNVHSITSWFNEKPRLALEIAVVLGGIVHPLMQRFAGRGLGERPWWLFPTSACLATAILAELSRLPERLPEIGLAGPYLQGIRPSELQELFFFYFILIYLVSLYIRLRRRI
jgi:hypothetical protein